MLLDAMKWRGDPNLNVIDRLARKYTGKPFPFRDKPAERVVLVIAVERARYGACSPKCKPSKAIT